MKRGLVFSMVLHVALFVAVLLGPGPKSFEWDRVDAIPVDLVAPRLEDRLPPSERPSLDPVPPRRLPTPSETPPVSEVVEEPEPAPEPEDPKPEPPKEQPKPKPQPPARDYKKFAPAKKDEASLAERLKQRLTSRGEEATPPDTDVGEPSEDPVPPAASAPTASAEVIASDFPYAWYLNTLRTKIADSWDPPGDRMVTGRGNQVLVRFRVHRDGHVSDIRIEGASGAPGLDASARRAVERASPFPPLPNQWVGDHLDAVVRFNVSEGPR